MGRRRKGSTFAEFKAALLTEERINELARLLELEIQDHPAAFPHWRKLAKAVNVACEVSEAFRDELWSELNRRTMGPQNAE